MLRAALAGQQRLVLDECELGRAGPSYSVDTLLEIRGEIGEERSLTLLLGADAFAGLPSWHRWRDLFSLAHVGVLTRPRCGVERPDKNPHLAAFGDLPIALRTWIASRRARDPGALAGSPAGRVAAIEVTPLDISASGLRELIAGGRDPRWLLPDALLADPALLAVYRRGPASTDVPHH
ncbi:MAG: hypothetical protein WBW61_05545, partial [Rhodanobacteraceae bacterium]